MTRLLDKDERTRLGSKSGASSVKQHKWFAKVNWGLLRNMRPPVSVALTIEGKAGKPHSLIYEQIVPAASNGAEAANFRQLRESHSLHLEEQAGQGARGEEDVFEAFSSVTLHYDGDS